MKLIDSKTRKPIAVGDVVTTFRGESVTVDSFDPPTRRDQSGRVFVRNADGCIERVYASVIDAEYFPRTDRYDRYTAFVRFPNGDLEEIDVDAADERHARDLAQAELARDYVPGGRIIEVRARFGLYI